MPTPVTAYTDHLRKQGRLPAPLVDSLQTALESELCWEKTQKDDVTMWVAKPGGWQIVLADFSIADQPGHSPSERGQNVAMSCAEAGVMLMSDGELQHELANYLYHQSLLRQLDKALSQLVAAPAEQPDRQAVDHFAGQGQVKRPKVVHMKQEGDRYVLDSVEHIEAAVTWMEQHIAKLNGAVWGIPESGTYFKFNEAERSAEWWGNPHSATVYLLTTMGWTVLHTPKQT